jgi:hypothetical protein
MIMLSLSIILFGISHGLWLYLISRKMSALSAKLSYIIEIARENAVQKSASTKPIEKKAANRSVRTEEQKQKASQQRKEWWAKKRAMDQSISQPFESKEKI